MRRAPRLDENHQEIVRELRRLGYEVLNLAGMADGVPDVLLSNKQAMWLVEIKVEDAPYTRDQLDFYDRWKGKPVLTFRRISDVRFFHDCIAPTEGDK